MTEEDKKLVIRNATMEDLFAVAAVEAECFPVSEAATEAEFRRKDCLLWRTFLVAL